MWLHSIGIGNTPAGDLFHKGSVLTECAWLCMHTPNTGTKCPPTAGTDVGLAEHMGPMQGTG